MAEPGLEFRFLTAEMGWGGVSAGAAQWGAGSQPAKEQSVFPACLGSRAWRRSRSPPKPLRLGLVSLTEL